MSNVMISADLRSKALEHAMILFRASGPITKSHLRQELLTQTTGVDSSNIDGVLDWVWDFLLKRRAIALYNKEYGSYDLRNR